MKKETLKIEGMSCNHCVVSVEKALQAAAAGVAIDNVEIGKAEVSFNPAEVNLDQLISAIEDVGFEVLRNEN